MRVVTYRFDWENGRARDNGVEVMTGYEDFCRYVREMGVVRGNYPGFDRSFIVDDSDATEDFTVIDQWFGE